MSLSLIRVIGVVALLGYVALLGPVLRASRRRAGRSFALFFIATLVWQAGVTVVSFAPNPQLALSAYLLTIGLGTGISLFFAQFARDFLGVRSRPWIMQLGYVLFGLMALWMVLGGAYVVTEIYRSPVTGLWLPVFGPLMAVYAAAVYLYTAYGAALLLRYHQRATSTFERNRIRFLLFGLLILVAGSLANLSPVLRPYPVDMILNALFAFTIAYAILRYQLLDISVVVRKGLVYSLLTATIGALYFLGVFLALNLFHVVTGYQIFLLSLFLAAVTAVVMQPLRDAMQSWLDRLFFREKYDAGLMLKRLSRTAASVLQIDRLTEMILYDVLETMHISSGALFIKDEKGGDYRLSAYRGSDPNPGGLSHIRHDSPVISWLSSRQTALTSRVLETNPSFIGLWTRERDDLKRLKAELLVPLLAAGKLIGVLVLGPKLSETSFTREEQLILDTLANQTAVAVENARLFSETAAEKERTATIVEQAFTGIILLDSELRVVGLNPAAEAIINCDSAKAVGAPISDVLGGSILNERGSLQRAMATGQRVAPREEMLAVGERRRDVLLGVAPLRDGYLLSLADVTQLKEVDRLKSDIVANVSHEFRTPLAIIKAYSELLMDDAQGGNASSRHEYLEIIDAETDRLAGMVSGLLDLARLEAGRGSIVLTPINLADVIAEVDELLQPQAADRAVAVNVAIAPDLPILQANRELLIAMVSNLTGNAIKFSQPGGRVDVVARQADGFVVLQVRDRGIGMSEEDLAHLFEKFYRGSTAKAAGVRGTGLGLVLTKEATEAHGGTIAVESHLGVGTCFTVTLPVGNTLNVTRPEGRPTEEAWLADPLLVTSAEPLVGA
jgi:signal transduction histidine kinase